jgi:hypothetical protein
MGERSELHVLFFIELGSHRVHLADTSCHPTREYLAQTDSITALS